MKFRRSSGHGMRHCVTVTLWVSGAEVAVLLQRCVVASHPVPSPLSYTFSVIWKGLPVEVV